MGRTGQVLVPSIEVIVEINRRFIILSGEEYVVLDNLLNRTSLEYVLEAITDRPFGVDAFPDVFQKAAAIAERIIVNHVFMERTSERGF